MTFNKTYFLLFIMIFLIELGITYTKGFIRHTAGDFFVVILLYSFIKTFSKASPKKVALGVLSVAFFIEFLQLLKLSELFPKESLHIVSLILGNTFSLLDLLAYILGVACILWVESTSKKQIH